MFTKRKLIFLLIVIGISIGLVASDASANSSRRAIVRVLPDYCITSWLDDNLELTDDSWIVMDQHDVTQPNAGIRNFSCHGYVDFSSENFASIADICQYTDWSIFCNGNGNMTWGNSTKEFPIECWDDRGYITTKTQGVVTKSGEVNITCTFNIATP
jgi:hypothetical protein